jgi:type II restriction enzyme
MYCPACPADALEQAPRNSRVLDFVCGDCGAQFELKSQATPIRRKVCDAAYRTMAQKILGGTLPHFAFLHYDTVELEVISLILVPSHFLTLRAIEKRPPLAAHARRAGWVGCNILLDAVPTDGRLPVVMNRDPAHPATVRAQWRRFSWMAEQRLEARGWAVEVLRCLRDSGLRVFGIEEAYAWEGALSALYPRNRHVRAKIRQQLQVLRDRGLLRFLGDGRYEVLS